MPDSPSPETGVLAMARPSGRLASPKAAMIAAALSPFAAIVVRRDVHDTSSAHGA